MTVDPSKFCHNLKRMKDDREDSSNIDALTWHLREENPVHIKNKKPYKKDPDFAIKKCSIIKRKKVKSSSNVYKDDNCVNFDSDEVSSVGGYTSSDEDSVSSADTDIIIAKQSQRNHLKSCGFQEPNLSSDNQGLNVSQTVDSNSDSGDSSTSTELLASKNGPNLDNYSMHWEDNSTDDETESDFENTSLKEMTTIGNEELSAFRSESNKTISNIALPPFKGTSSLYGSRDSKVQERSTEDRASFGDLPSTTTVTVVSSQTASNRMEPSSSTTELHKQGDKGDICGLISMGKSLKVLKNDRVTDSIEKERQKSRESELKRLESMMERSKETERKKKAIHQALALVSGK